MKITRHRHGMEICWADIFFLYDGRMDQQGTYRAAVEAKGMMLASYSVATLEVMTPAQQMLWRKAEGGHVLNPFMHLWLEQNVGERGPDWYAREQPFDIFFLSILFRRRCDALKMIRYVDSALRAADA